MPEQEMFHGDGRSKENPHDYKKNLMLKFMGKGLSDLEKKEALGLGMASGSTADSWFDEPVQKAMTTWAEISTAFDAKWPKRAALKRVGQDAIEDLLAEKLSAAEIGKRVTHGGGEEFGHVVWVRKMVRISSNIPDPAGLFIGVVREKLPMIMQDLLGPGTAFADWAVFETAVVGLNRAEILNAQAKEARLVEMSRTVTARAQVHLPTAVHPQRFAQQVYAPYPHFPAAQQPAPPQPAHQQQQAPAPPAARTFRPESERLVDLLRNLPAHHPATDVGRAAYQQQVSDWDARNGNRGPNEYRPYPLTPGAAALDATGDCYNCALLGHTTAGCGNPPMPPLEKKWRQIAASIRNGARRTTQAAVPVHYVGAQYPYDPNPYNHNGWYSPNPYASYSNPHYTNDQGNGEGSSS
ncbi:hypothetical protein C8R46DRAFT_1065387 [Mycena filopes]|nr:hypothetical protein C8R46DRAFT_1065387 [Mycena filopes]